MRLDHSDMRTSACLPLTTSLDRFCCSWHFLWACLRPGSNSSHPIPSRSALFHSVTFGRAFFILPAGNPCMGKGGKFCCVHAVTAPVGPTAAAVCRLRAADNVPRASGPGTGLRHGCSVRPECGIPLRAHVGVELSRLVCGRPAQRAWLRVRRRETQCKDPLDSEALHSNTALHSPGVLPRKDSQQTKHQCISRSRCFFGNTRDPRIA